MIITCCANQKQRLHDGMQPRRLETSRHAQVLNVAGNQLSGPIPGAWARDPKAADGSVFPDLRVATLLPSAGRSFANCMHHFCQSYDGNNRLCSRACFVCKGCRRGRGLLALLQASKFVPLWLICTLVCTAGDTSAHQAFVAARRQWAPVRRRAAGLPARRAAQQQRRWQQPGLCGARRRASLADLPNAAAARGRLASTCTVQMGGECGREL